jgi:lactoylglutathione lyase
MITRLAHICFKTDHTKEMVHFYKDLLQLDLKFTFKLQSGEDFGYYFDLGNQTFLELFDQKGAVAQWGGQIQDLAQQERSPYQHFCLQVDHLEQLVASLQSKQVDVIPIKVGIDHSKQAWIQDPDGNRIELMEYTEHSLQLQ